MKVNDEKKNAVIGARIMQRRKLLGMKQSELAELIGVSDNQISNIENGRSYPKLNSFMLICKALDCNADYFFSAAFAKISNVASSSARSMITIVNTIWLTVFALPQ